MASKKMTESDSEQEALRAKVSEAARALQPHHYQWMITAARDHFMQEIERAEMSIVRHERFTGQPYPHFLSEHSRESEIADAERGLVQNRAILVFLLALGRLSSHMQAVKFAEGIASWFRSKS